MIFEGESVTGDSQSMSYTAVSHDDAVKSWLSTIGRIHLMTPEQELEAAKCAAQGCQSCRKRLIEANFRLVISIAKKYAGRGIALSDLVQEGNIGLMKAVEKYDWTKGNRFSTYATWWVRQSITKTLQEKSRAIRLPSHVAESLSKVLRAKMKLQQSLQREPVIEELAQEADLPIKKVRQVCRVMYDAVSLDMSVGEKSEDSLGELIPSANCEHEYEETLTKMRIECLVDAVKNLPDREREVLTLRYGLEDMVPRTLEVIATELEMTRERVRQIERRAIKRLNNSDASPLLRAYWE